MERRSLNFSNAGLMTVLMANGPMNLGANFLDSTLRGRSRVESHTFWPTKYVGLGCVAGWPRQSNDLPSGGEKL